MIEWPSPSHTLLALGIAMVAVIGGVILVRGFTRGLRHPWIALILTGAALGALTVGLGLVWLSAGPNLDDLVPEAETATATAKPTPEAKANFLLFVSNQSSNPETVHIDVQLDGVTVVNQNFAVEFQHNWVEFPLWLPPGNHEVIVVSDTGVKMVKHFKTPDVRRDAIVSYWGRDDDGGKRFAWMLRKVAQFA